MSGKDISVLCVDDNADMVFMLSTLVDAEPDMRSVGTLASADELVAVAEQLKPRVIVLDLTMPGKPPLQAMEELWVAAPGSRVIVLSGYDDAGTENEVMSAGAWALISKSRDINEVINAIRRVASKEEGRDAKDC